MLPRDHLGVADKRRPRLLHLLPAHQRADDGLLGGCHRATEQAATNAWCRWVRHHAAIVTPAAPNKPSTHTTPGSAPAVFTMAPIPPSGSIVTILAPHNHAGAAFHLALAAYQSC